MISAAAGSGKTAVLVQRVFEKITAARQPCLLSDLLIITFSNAAADEMYLRIKRQLQQQLLWAPSDQHLKALLKSCETANISTFHAFCFKIIKENANVFDLSYDCEVASDYEVSELKNKAFSEIVDEFYFSENWEQLTILNGLSHNNENLFKNVKKLHGFARSKPFYLDFLDSIVTCYQSPIQPFDVFLKTAFKYSKRLIKHCIHQTNCALNLLNEAPKYQKVFTNDLNNLEALLERISQSNNLDDARKHISFLSFENLPIAKYELEATTKQQVFRIRKSIKEKMNLLRTKLFCFDDSSFQRDRLYSKNYFELLVKITKAFDQRFNELKHENNLIDFEDIEQLTLSLFISKQPDGSLNKTPMAKEIGKQFQEILVDEYQDINEIQDLIFSALSKDGSNLFAVGDVKQSIYRFRHTAPEIFLNWKDSLPDYDGKHFPARLFLKNNFRSAPTIINAINFIFKKLISEETTEFDYDHSHELIATGQNPPAASFSLNILEFEGSAEETTKFEAKHIAQQIYQKIADPSYLVTEGNLFRRAKYSDFCILLRSPERKADIYRDALLKRGIPTISGSPADFFTQKEIMLLISFLKIINNPMNEIDLVAIMHSNLFAFTLDEIYQLQHNDPNVYLYSKVIKSSDAKCKHLAYTLDLCFKKSASVPVCELIDYIYNEVGFLAIALSQSTDVELTRNNLNLFLDFARSSEFDSLNEFLKSLDVIMQNTQNPFSSNNQFQNIDAVKIMSIHKAKGLEFPICFLADAHKEFNKADLKSSMLLSNKLKASCTRYVKETMQQQATFFKQATIIALQDEMIEEEIRLLYVALTRAKMSIIIPIITKNFAEKLLRLQTDCQLLDLVTLEDHPNYAEFILLALLSHPGFCNQVGVPCANTDPYNAKFDVNFAGDLQEAESIAVLPTQVRTLTLKETEKIAKNINFIYPFEEILSLPSRVSVSELLKNLEEAPRAESKLIPKFLSENRISNADRGTILHKFLQLCDYKSAQKNLCSELSRLTDLGKLTQAEFQAIETSQLSGFFVSDFYQKVVCKAKTIHREVKFSTNLRPDQIFETIPNSRDYCDMINVHGKVDCILEFENESFLLDFKSNRITSLNVLAERYRKQLYVYKLALTAAQEKPITKLILYSLALQKEIYV
ncbi:ATP-dependent helicase/nuclease subunit A [Clostridia bacterium]|nr:ATP-dependent helicase/nuclease subunit A [Clostridia bacterium]